MSKAKKIISMLLAVLMVMSVVPASVIASAAPADEVATFKKPDTATVVFSTDTSETSEVIRVAGGEGAFTRGTTVVAATPSGIPKADSGQFISVAYAGETPTFPMVSFKIKGVRPDAQPTIVSNLGSNLTLVTETTGTQNAAGEYVYTWRITGGQANQGEVVTFTITYYVSGTAHYAYAYSYVEHILIMNGYVSHKYQNGGDHTPDTRHAYSVQVGGANMYAGWYNNMAENIGRGFINYAAGSAMEGGSLLGTGTSPEGFADNIQGFAVDDGVTTTGTPYGSMIKTIDNQTKDDWVNVAYGLNGNRTESYLYIDKRNETLDSLKVRVSLQACDKGNDDGPWPYTDFQDVEVLNGAVEFGAHDQWSAVSTKATSLISIGEITKNVDKTRITSIDPGQSHRYAWLGGGGPALQNGTTKYQNTLLVYANEMASNSNGETWNQEIGALGLTFVVYNTNDLYNVFYGIMKGANLNGSSSYTTSNLITYTANSGETAVSNTALTINFTKGAHPQAAYYSGGWDTFLTAYQNAGRVLSKPDTNQLAINQATKSLIEAYNGLTGFNPTVNYTIKHCIKGGSTEIVNASTSGYTAAAQTGTVAAGTEITGYAADIDGFILDGDSIKKVTATGATSEVTITFYYTREYFNVNAQTNNETLEEYLVGSETKNVRMQIFPVQYGTTFNKATATNGDGDVSRPGVGSKPYYEFIDWYYQDGSATGTWDETQRVPASFTMGKSNVTIYGRWDTKPLHIYATPMLDNGTVINNGNKIDLGSVKPTTDGNPVQFARPSADKMAVEGYLFVGYYQNFTNTFTGEVEWPQTFVLGDSDRMIYARYADVNGKIVFEPNGGTACADLPFTAGATLAESEFPVPTKLGYNFAGWYYDEECTSSPVTYPVTMPDQTGFIAYAKWEAKDITIYFDTAVGANPTKFDTASIAPIYPARVGQPVDEDMIPANPRRFGYTFAGWTYNGIPFDFSKVPVADESITILATWRRSDASAFISLDAVEKVLGEEVVLDANNTVEEDDEIVQHGDIITVRMTSMTNFYTGSSLFIFMYDKNFYELIGSGKDAFTLNTEDSYIGGINAKYTAVTESSNLPWPAGMDSTTYNAMQIAIDPTVAVDNYNCEPMDGNTWMIEFKLKVKDDATGSGKIFMDNAWTRTPDNIMGTMFYGWSATGEIGENGEGSVINTENNRVTPELSDALRTLRIDTEEPVETTVILNTQDGTWADGTATDKTYTGTAGAEILDYAAPTKTGYTLDGWYATAGDNTSAKWIEGYYPPEDTLTATYYAYWAPNSYPVVFHWDAGDEAVYKEASALYNEQIAADIVAEPTRAGYKFAGWVDKDGNLVTLPTTMTVADDTGYHLYATWTPATDTKFSIKIYYPNNSYDPNVEGSQQYIVATQTTDKNNAAFQGTTGQTVAIVQAVPADADPNTLYITLDRIRPILGGNVVFDPDNAGNYVDDPNKVIIDSTVIAADGSAVLEVYYIGKIITYTFDANGGTFAGGKTTLEKTGRFQSAFTGLAESELPTREGYDFAGWNRTPVATFTSDATYTAQWTAKKAHVRFMLSETEQYGDLVEVEVGKAPAAPTNPSKPGWTFVGWNTDPDATTGVTTLPAVNNIDSADGYAVTYYAIFTKTPYTVTYSLVDPVTGASEQYGTTETYYMDDVVTVRPADAADLVKKGYTFNGWAHDGAAAGATFTIGTSNVELVGTYTAKTIKVKFYADEGAYESGADYVEVETTFNETINLPAVNPAKTGYTFQGWAATPVAAAGSTSLGTLTEEEASYYAVYTPEEHTYYIDVYEMGLDGEYPAAPTRTTEGKAYVDDTVTITSTNDVTGFTLVTATSQNGTVPAEGELRFTVKYERKKFNLIYVVDGTETSVEYFYGATPDASKAPDTTKEGYTFQSWDPAVPATIPAENTTVTAVYTVNQYSVKFYADQNKLDTELVYNQKHDFASEIPVVGEQFRTGYVFKGWAYDGTTEVIDLAANKQYVPSHDVTFVGIWETDSYRLNYRGATGIHEYFMVPYGTPASEWPVPATAPAKEGSYFNGWSDSGLATMPADVVTISPIFVTETYKLQFANTGDTTYGENNVITVTYGDIFDGVADPEWAGHVFEGWDNVIPTEIGDLGDDGATVVFTASWRNEKYTLKFANTGDTVIADKTVEFGDTIEATPNPEWAGHVFDKWDVTPPTSIGDLGNDGATITYTANWITETYTIKFLDTNDAGDAIEVPATFGGTITVPTGLTKTGYVFSGWTDAEGNDATPPTSITDLGENNAVITYKAKWTKDTFTITYDADNGTTAQTDSKEFEAEVTAPAAPEKEGHVFAGWINTKTNAAVSFPFNMPAENLSFKASWTKETYTIEFADTNDAGDSITMNNVEFGSALTAPTGLTKTGYVFSGWDTTPPATVGDLGENGTKVTYTAQWTKKTYTLKFTDTGDTTITDKVVSFGDTIEVPTGLTKEGQGYYFTETWKDANGNAVTPPTTIEDMGADGAEFTYVAQWAKETYTINFETGEGASTVPAIVVQYGDAVTKPGTPTKEGHTFVQWVDAEGNAYSVPAIMPDLGENNAAITLTAEWAVVGYMVTFYDAEKEIYHAEEVDFGEAIAPVVPETLPEKVHYITLGWSLTENDTVAITDFGTMPAHAVFYFPAFERVVVALKLTEGTTAETFEIDESDPEVKVGYIRGLKTKLTKTALEDQYLGVTGDGTLIITPSWGKMNICGTGTMIEVYDNVDKKVVERYYVVIYGDVNGDSGISATDVTALLRETNGLTSWSVETDAEEDSTYNKAYVLAGDLKADGVIDALDAAGLKEVTLAVSYIDQATGTVSYY